MTTNAKIIEYDYEFSAATKYVVLSFDGTIWEGYKPVKVAKEIVVEMYISKC